MVEEETRKSKSSIIFSLLVPIFDKYLLNKCQDSFIKLRKKEGPYLTFLSLFMNKNALCSLRGLNNNAGEMKTVVPEFVTTLALSMCSFEGFSDGVFFKSILILLRKQMFWMPNLKRQACEE
ncbi:hypothetical protein AVEN_177096-1 [Araneus ventricosus]|uniref:Uncharacterized protein n=1 Tax=Araneus ventricosus TaxID=182803 RepID=A0A4Y2CTL7_ARAVE|nr:hypothetical protein AVEN_177096-1 [Araneus ventricosus]